MCLAMSDFPNAFDGLTEMDALDLEGALAILDEAPRLQVWFTPLLIKKGTSAIFAIASPADVEFCGELRKLILPMLLLVQLMWLRWTRMSALSVASVRNTVNLTPSPSRKLPKLCQSDVWDVGCVRKPVRNWRSLCNCGLRMRSYLFPIPLRIGWMPANRQEDWRNGSDSVGFIIY